MDYYLSMDYEIAARYGQGQQDDETVNYSMACMGGHFVDSCREIVVSWSRHES